MSPRQSIDRRPGPSSLAPRKISSSSPTLEQAHVERSQLVLVHDPEPNELDIVPMTEDDEDNDNSQSESRSAFKLSPIVVLLYMTSSSLRLGALLLSDLDTHIPWKILLAALITVAAMTLVTTQVWIRIARYVRKSSVADVIADGIVGKDEGVKYRKVVKGFVKVGGIVTNVLLCSVYIRVFLDSFLPMLPRSLYVFVGSCSLVIVLMSLFIGGTLASRRIIISTLLSVLSYLVALVLMIYITVKGIPGDGIHLDRRPLMDIWESTSVIEFAFASPFVLPLYAALASQGNQPYAGKKRRLHPFSILTLASTTTALALLIPLIFLIPGLANNHNTHESSPNSQPLVIQVLTALRGISVLTAVPSIIAILPTPNSNGPWMRFSNRPRRIIWKAIFVILITVFALTPRAISADIKSVAMALCIIGSYLLPALLHITHHHVRRPHAIIIPSHGALLSQSGDESESEDLLLQKERTLQRRRLNRRIVWDVAVWLILLPISIFGIAWAVGRSLRRW